MLRRPDVADPGRQLIQLVQVGRSRQRLRSRPFPGGRLHPTMLPRR
jgi:hypothetical protein